MDPTRLDLPGACVDLYHNVFDDSACDRYFELLSALPDWEAREIVVYGRPCKQNRLTCFYAADPSLNYRYSGINNANAPVFPSFLQEIREVAEGICGCSFNYCLLNWYPNGKSTIGWHADDERDLAPGSKIASFSFGAERYFDFRRKDNHKEKTRVTLTNGCLLVMGEGTQTHYHHQVPQQARVLQPRINLTFRSVK